MEGTWEFYADDKGENFRAVKALGDDQFIVVKLFRDEEVFTFKVWEGDFFQTLEHWTTRHRVRPTQYLRARLRVTLTIIREDILPGVVASFLDEDF